MSFSPTDESIKINGTAYPIVIEDPRGSQPAPNQQFVPWTRERKRTKWHSYLTPDELPFQVQYRGTAGIGRTTPALTAGYAYATGVTNALPYQTGVAAYPTVLTTPVLGTGWNLFVDSATFQRSYIAGGRYLLQMNGSTAEFYYDAGVGKTITSLTMYQGNLFVGLGSTAGVFFSAAFVNNSPSATSTALPSGDTWNYAVVGRNAANQALWVSSHASPYKVYNIIGANDPTDSTKWNGPFPVRDASTNITALYTLDYLLYVHKYDGLYAVDESGNFRILLPELEQAVSTTSGSNGSVWFGGLVLPEAYGLLYYNNDVVYHVGPEVIPVNDTPIHAAGPLAVSVVGKHVWYLCKGDDANYYILTAAEPGPGDQAAAQLMWHAVYQFDTPTYGTPLNIAVVRYGGGYYLRVGTTTKVCDIPLDSLGRPTTL